MTKLKTLKDFTSFGFVNGKAMIMITPEDIKAEAIKWVKSAREPDWWKFFNITSEDLK